jgi:hypothetical protein
MSYPRISSLVPQQITPLDGLLYLMHEGETRTSPGRKDDAQPAVNCLVDKAPGMICQDAVVGSCAAARPWETMTQHLQFSASRFISLTPMFPNIFPSTTSFFPPDVAFFLHWLFLG